MLNAQDAAISGRFCTGNTRCCDHQESINSSGKALALAQGGIYVSAAHRVTTWADLVRADVEERHMQCRECDDEFETENAIERQFCCVSCANDYHAGDTDPAARAALEDRMDRNAGDNGAWNDPGAPFRSGDY